MAQTTLGDIMMNRRSIEWLWEPYLPRGSVTTLGAKSGVGKSAFALWLAVGFARAKGLKTLYVDLEQSLGHIKDRAEKWHLEDVSELIYIPTEPDENVGLESLAPDFATITADAKSINASLIIIDSLTSLYSKFDIEKRAGASLVMRELRSISVKTNAALLLLAHTNKANIDNITQLGVDNITGSAAIVDLSRSVLFLSQDEVNRQLKMLTHLKCNYAPLAEPMMLEVSDTGMEFLEETKPYHVCSTSKMDMLVQGALDKLASEPMLRKRDLRRAVKDLGASETEASRVWQRLLESGKVKE